MLKNILYILPLLVGNCLFAQKTKSYANEYLNIGVDAVALAMGNTMVAHSENSFSTYWNPSGLARTKNDEIGLMHANYFGNIAQFDYAAYSTRINEDIGVGIGITRFGVDNILNTTDLINQEGVIDYSKITKFSTADYAFNASIGYQTITEGLTIGGSVKILHRSIGDFASAWGYGLDASLQYFTDQWKFGALFRDFTTTETVWDFNQKEIEKIRNLSPEHNNSVPERTERSMPRVQLGAARLFQLHEKFGLLTSAQMNIDLFESNAIVSSKYFGVNPSLGAEINYNNIVFLRMGLNNFQYEKRIDDSKKISFQPNAGVGFYYKGISVDYALTNIANQGIGVYSHIFSLKLNFEIFK